MFFHYLGIATAAWLGFGALVGVALVVSTLANYFCAGFRYGAMGMTVLLCTVAWPAMIGQVFRGGKRGEREYERREAIKSRQAVRMYRFILKDGAWYRNVRGVHQKWLTDGFGRNYDPEQAGHDVERIREADYACNNGEWTEGECPLCGAPERGNSVCGMRATEFVGVPQYTPKARLMRDAPEKGFILAVSNTADPDRGFFPSDGVTLFHEVEFRQTGPGRGLWVDRSGQVVERLHGWWTLPERNRTQSSDAMEEPHLWIGDEPPAAYDSRAAWDAVMARRPEPATGETHPSQ